VETKERKEMVADVVLQWLSVFGTERHPGPFCGAGNSV
jgi:hypothetical protein